MLEKTMKNGVRAYQFWQICGKISIITKTGDNMHYIYIVECSDKTLYTGYTNDLDKRMKAHNQKKGAKYTRGRTPVILMYYEEFDNKIDAMKREAKIKKLRRAKKQKLIKQKEM